MKKRALFKVVKAVLCPDNSPQLQVTEWYLFGIRIYYKEVGE